MDFKLLSKAKTYPWVMNLNISFRGYFLWNDTLFNQNNVIDFLSSYNTIEKVTSLLNELNGSFSICMEFEQQILIAVDRQRSLPLFYAIEQNCLYISHSASMIIDQLNVKTINSISVEELKSTSLFVTGKDTLIAEISQVCAGHLCVFNKSNLSSVQKEYFSYQWSDFYQDSKDELKLRFNAAYKKVGENMIKALNGRTAVIPLSGGYDSRMILQQLVEGGYKKILCYTYGNPNEEECLISKQVAQKYGVEWHIIPYTYSLMKSFYHSEEFKDYFSMEGNVVSLPHLQDLVAVLELKKQGVFPLDSVFIPGHSGDLIAGTGIPKLFMEYDRIFSKKDCVDAILAKHYPNNKVSIEVKNKLNATIVEKKYNAEEGAAIVEKFNYNERQSKFIINSVRVYEFVGFEWLVPLWYNDIVEFWSHIPTKLRYARGLYHFCVDNKEEITTVDENCILAKIRKVTNKCYPIRILAKMLNELTYWFNNYLYLRTIIPFSTYLLLVLKHPKAYGVSHIWLIQYLVIPNLKAQVSSSKKNNFLKNTKY